MRGREGASLRRGAFFKTELDPETVSGVNEFNDLREMLSQTRCQLNILDKHYGKESDGVRVNQGLLAVLIVDKAYHPHFFIVLDDDVTLELALVRSEVSATVPRTPEAYQSLTAKSVGIIGVGSAGSKIASTLARMGMGEFFLVDHDIFFPENMERHVLDWSYVGDHKAEGVSDMLSRISSRITVDVSRVHLTGQESTATVSGVLRKLSQCDLLIDATANPRVFNLLSSVALASQKPLLWLEVYAGGMGGLIARSRPGRDPAPQVMRGIYNQYCSEHPAPDLQLARDYAAQEPDGRVLVASDADVSIIAHHAARLAVDTALGCDPSAYPYSMYLIGLAHWWVFQAPFHTIPIDTDGFQGTEATTTGVTSSEEQASGLRFIGELLALEKERDAASSSS
jgi:molybdopterin/thiamine biosynthesis adenylyltransferase